MVATAQIDQVGLPTGAPGVSRTDGLANGAEVTLTNTNIAAVSSRFSLEWIGLGDTTALATLAQDSTHVWKFTPTPAAYGSYVIVLIEDEDLTTQRIERRIFGIRLPNSGLLIPALNERASSSANIETPTSGELVDFSDDNAIDYVGTLAAALNALPFAGWWRKMVQLILAVEAGGGGGGAPTLNPGDVLGNPTESPAPGVSVVPQSLLFRETFGGSGTKRLRVAPDRDYAITATANGATHTRDISLLLGDGHYDMAIRAKLKRATTGDYRTVSGVLSVDQVGGQTVVQGTLHSVLSGDSTGLALTVTILPGPDLRIQIANTTGESVSGVLHIGWEFEDLVGA